jgi:hypothetical protein
LRNQLQLDLPVPTVTITPYDYLSYGHALGQTLPASAAPVANRAVYQPFVLYKPATAYSIFVVNGSAVSGNLDMGIYDHAGRLVASIGSTAQAGVSDIQEVSFASPVTLGPGLYYMAVALDNATGHFYRRSVGAPEAAALGQYQESNNMPLAATAVFDQLSSSYCPLMGVRFYDPS